MRLPKLDGLSLAQAGMHLSAHVGCLAQTLGLPPHEVWKHDGTEREAFTFSAHLRQWRLQQCEVVSFRGCGGTCMRPFRVRGSIWFRRRSQDLRIMGESIPTSRDNAFAVVPEKFKNTATHSHFWTAGVDSNEAERKRGTKTKHAITAAHAATSRCTGHH